ncbi:hypothetical protein BC659_0590 [Sediminibacterium goheungense]|uniref:Uncharacterized protein n=1 Tax=Sediminibacterium goheungense TaxID=1086393 RepID=A0A4R6J016_9BACT|nr:hypothetical protein BC659_0590 [Sediminibacterium goheungense]
MVNGEWSMVNFKLEILLTTDYSLLTKNNLINGNYSELGTDAY